MPPSVASIVFGIGIAGLFFLDRRERRGESIALWIPTTWLFFSASRPLTAWLGIDSAASEAMSYSEGSPIDRALFILLEVIALVVVLRRGRKVARLLGKNWPIGVFFIYALISMAWSDYPFVTFKHWIKGIGDVLMILIVFTEPDVAEAVRRVATRLGFVLVPWSLLLIRYYPLLGRAYSVGGTSEPTGVAMQKNGLGGLCEITGIALLWCFRSAYKARKSAERLRRLLALGVTLAVIVWLLALCNSVTSISALGLASGVMLVSNRPAFRRKPLLIHLFAVGAIAITVYALFFQSSGTLLRTLGRNPTLTGRTDIWNEVLSIPNNRLVGVGYESFWLSPRLEQVQEALHVRLNEAHNGYLEVFLDLGWIGVVSLGCLIGFGYRNVITSYRSDPDIGSFRMAWFLAVVINALTEATFRMMGLPWICFLISTANSSWDVERKVGRRRGQPARFPETTVPVRDDSHNARVVTARWAKVSKENR